MHPYLIVLALAASAVMAATAAPASEALQPALARRLDARPAAFTASAAKRERMLMIQQNMEEQRRYGRSGGRGYNGYQRGDERDPGYRRRPGNLPPYDRRRPHSDRW